MDTPQQSSNLIARQYAQFRWFEFHFSGKATRQEFLEEGALYGFLQLIVYPAAFVIAILMLGIGIIGIIIGYLLGLSYLLLIIIHVVGLCVRRLRDTGKSWPYIFLVFIPLAGPVIVLYLLMEDSVPETAGASVLPPVPTPAATPAPAPAFIPVPPQSPPPAPASAPAICSVCNGSGVNAAGHTCPVCSGRGVA